MRCGRFSGIFAVPLVATCLQAFAGGVSYEYDALRRLTKIVYDDGTSITYEYDAAGNRISVVAVSACARIAADAPSQTCVGCADCSCATCEDGRVEMCEMIGYACAWKKGCNDDLSGMTRAAYLWKAGECHCWENVGQSWNACLCPPPASGCCLPVLHSTDGGVVAGPRPPQPGWPSVGRIQLVRKGAGSQDKDVEVTPAPTAIDGKPRRPPGNRREHDGRRKQVTVPIGVTAPAGSAVMALECWIPEGWRVLNMSDGGTWDASHRKVKWGPFFDNLSRTVTVKLRPPTNDARLDDLYGTVSIDGVNRRIAWE